MSASSSTRRPRTARTAGSDTERCPHRRRRRDALSEADRLAGDPVRPVGADEHLAGDPLARPEHDGVAGLDRDLHALAHLHPTLARRIEQERVEAPALRHPHDRLLRGANHAGPYRNRSSIWSTYSSTTGEGSTGHCRTARSVIPPPQGLSRGNFALSARAASPPARRACRRSSTPTGRPRPRWRRSASHPGGYNAAHPGGVPERPKGTGCKPVGSAYGGSNPPASIVRAWKS